MGMDVQGGHTMEYFTPVFNLRNSLWKQWLEDEISFRKSTTVVPF